MTHPPITLAITHFNRFWYLQECIDQVKDDPRIGEIVISDDASTDGSFERLCLLYQNNPKIKLTRNEKNLDCYFNKHRAVLKSSCDWVILFDSDNVIKPSYLDRLQALPEWDPNVLYCPDFAEPHFDYTPFAGKIVDRKTIASLMPLTPHTHLQTRKWRPPLPPVYNPQPRYGTALNTCNYFVHRQGYLQVWDGSVNPHTSDSIYQAYNWLKAGKRILIVPGLRYYHRVHEDSHYKLNLHKTGSFSQLVESRLRELR